MRSLPLAAFEFVRWGPSSGLLLGLATVLVGVAATGLRNRQSVHIGCGELSIKAGDEAAGGGLIALVEDGHRILSNRVLSQVPLHERFGGAVIEEVHEKTSCYVIDREGWQASFA